MSIDARQLRVAEAVRLLNSTPMGEVIQPHVVYRHVNRAGFRIGDGKRIDLVRYAAWLFHDRRESLGARDGGTGGDYETMKESANARNRALSESVRDIASEGWVHSPVDPARRAAALGSFRLFCEAYFKRTFYLEWSPDHLKVIAHVEQAVVDGGLFALAMPRGSGKTSLCETACLWAILTGAREFVCLIGSDEEHAGDMLDSIKSELENNDLLEQDFSEVCGPIRALEGIHQRASGQLYAGARTHVGWTAKEIVLPAVEGSIASGAIITVAGITGRVRGMKHKRRDGQTVRPSLVLVDDPQTDDSARSSSQCATREQILHGAILGLAGPGRKIAGLMTLTIVRPGDMADRLLDRDKSPDWQGERYKMVYAFPKAGERWDEYAKIRTESLKTGGTGAEATEFYRNHRAEMDEGAVVAWPQRHNPDEISAIQHAMNLKLRDENAFSAEYQNEPHRLSEDTIQLTADDVMSRVNGLPRGIAPVTAEILTLFVDVHAELLYWVACAWSPSFDGSVIDYGTFPEQNRAFFTLRKASPMMSDVLPKNAGHEGRIYQGLNQLVNNLVARPWKREDGAPLRQRLGLVDAGYEWNTVTMFTRRSLHATMLLPSKGVGIGAAQKPIADYNRTQGDRIGFNWWIPRAKDGRGLRHARFDSNFWKSFVHGRLAIPVGGAGALALWGQRPADHQLFAEHVCAEYPTRTFGQGRQVNEWKQRPDRPDNHWFDGLVGCAVAACMAGASPLTSIAGKAGLGKRRGPVGRQEQNRSRVTYM